MSAASTRQHRLVTDSEPLPTRRPLRALSCALASVALLATVEPLRAQRPVGTRSELLLGAFLEDVRFGRDLSQPDVLSGDTMRVRRLRHATLPLTLRLHGGPRLAFDLSTVAASSEVTLVDAGGREQLVTLRGLGDVRLRATGALFDERVLLTFGATLPTGATQLGTDQLAALRAVAAPALALGPSAAGSGAGGTAGIVLTRRTRTTAMAVGTSYERRTAFQPLAIVTAGAPGTDLLPAHVLRVLATFAVTAGPHQLSIAGHVEAYGTEQLRRGGSAPFVPAAAIQPGPVLGADATWRFAPARTRELVLWSSARVRGAYASDGLTVPASGGGFVEGGLRTSLPAGRHVAFALALDGRHHTGLALDAGLPAAGVTSGSVSIAAVLEAWGFTVQPLLRGSQGRTRTRLAGSGAPFRSLTAGAVLRGTF